MKIPNQTFHIDSSICTDFPFYAFCISFSFYTFFLPFFFSLFHRHRYVYNNQTMVWHANIDIFYSIPYIKSTNSFLSFCFGSSNSTFYFRPKCAFFSFNRWIVWVCMKALMFTPIPVLMIMCWKNTSLLSLLFSFCHCATTHSTFKYNTI